MHRLPLASACIPAALVLLATPALAQDLQTPAAGPAVSVDAPPPANDQEVTFASDTMDYDDKQDIVTTTGNVRMLHQGNKLRADKVVWNRATGQVRAEGNVAITNPQGDTAYADSAELTDTLKDGVAENLLLVLEDGGRLAAAHGIRQDGVTTLDRAAYTPCRVVDADGCPKNPEWKITAVRVVHNPKTHRITYKDASFTLFGRTIMWLPAFSHPDGQGGGGNWGLLIPELQVNHTNGLEVGLPYYLQLGPNRDLTIEPKLFTAVAPALQANYRDLTAKGAFQVTGMITYGDRQPATLIPLPPGVDERSGFRGFIDANGRWQLDPYWSITASLRLTSDKTFLRRYDISSDDVLRSLVDVERIDLDSYLSIAGYGVQTLRVGDDQGQQPIVLPAIDYRLRFKDPWLGGQFEVQGNSLGIMRTEGQDTQRAFARIEWDLRKYTPWGQELTFTGYARGDVYHTDDVAATETVVYRGDPGWSARGIAALAADMRWPFVGDLWGGTQVITPRVQIVASPPTPNLSIPNEDARAIDLEDSNLFALNRFPGYDRWEDGARITYGAEWHYDRPKLSIDSVIGQSYRLSSLPNIFPDGTGLSDRTSDIVGRTSVHYGQLIELTHRFRLDKNSLALRRNEVDATVGSTKTYFEVGYFRLNRNIDTAIEDLRDSEEVRLGARVQVTRKISIFGSTVIDLTSTHEDPTSLSDGFSPVRDRVGVLYSDECLELGVTWRRDYQVIGDVRAGNTFSLRLALKNLGR